MEERTQRKTRVGRVVSAKMDKTAVIAVETRVRHSLYGRTVKHTRKFMAHDANNQCSLGDRVRIMETRPLSKVKRWRVMEILEKTEEI